ncbi:MAG TPA: hypothetical protein VGK67_35410 [Myxococcales bacterium]|jgi:hypothetical protein
MIRKLASPFALAFAAWLTACGPPVITFPDAAQWLHDCGSKEAAEKNAECTLTLDTEAQSKIDVLAKVDWWVLDVPALPPRALITVVAQYKVPSTPVVLTVNVTADDGSTSIATGTDPRRASSTSAGGPGPAQAVGKITKPGKYFVIVRHDTSADDPATDKRNFYNLLAKVESDPDLNEPNDLSAEATNVTLAACGSFAQATGALSTSGDVDRFKFDVTQCAGGRTILYVSIEAPASAGPQIRLNYVLNGPAGVVANDYSKSPMKDQLVATARLSAAGHYELALNAYKGPRDIVDPPGDTTFVYRVKVGLFPDLDTNEGATGNDSPETATDVGLSTGGSKVLEGRLSYTGDWDTYKVDVAGDARVYYKLEYTKAAGQFPAVPTLVPKQLTVFTVDKSAACASNCGGDPSYTVPWCNKKQCLHQERMDDSKIADYANYEGQLLMAAGTGPYYLQLSYTGAEGGDDIPYKLTVAVKPATAPSSLQNPRVVNLPGEGATAISWGWGAFGSGVPNDLPELPRSVLDYDKEHQVEFLEFHFVPPSPAVDQAFQLKWKIDPPAGKSAGRAYDVAMQLGLCADAGCAAAVPMPKSGYLGYASGQTNPWYVGKTDAGLPGMQEAYKFDRGTGTFEARSAMCTCLDAAHVSSGKIKVAVEAINRTSYDDSTIHLQFGLSSYPFTAVNDSGASFQCPAPCGWVGSY